MSHLPVTLPGAIADTLMWADPAEFASDTCASSPDAAGWVR